MGSFQVEKTRRRTSRGFSDTFQEVLPLHYGARSRGIREIIEIFAGNDSIKIGELPEGGETGACIFNTPQFPV